jgi:hypothetical protein
MVIGIVMIEKAVAVEEIYTLSTSASVESLVGLCLQSREHAKYAC